MPDADVTIETTPDYQTMITCENSVFRIVGKDGTEFEKWSSEPDIGESRPGYAFKVTGDVLFTAVWADEETEQAPIAEEPDVQAAAQEAQPVTEEPVEQTPELKLR